MPARSKVLTELAAHIPSIDSLPVDPSAIPISVPAFDRLPIDEREFILRYISPQSDTRFSARGSYKATYPTATINTASTEGSLSLKKPGIREALSQLLAVYHAEDKIRLGVLSLISTGRYISKTKVTTNGLDKSGKPYSTETITEKEPSSQDVIRANVEINKMLGYYEQIGAEGKAYSDALRARMKEERKAMAKRGEPKNVEADVIVQADVIVRAEADEVERPLADDDNLYSNEDIDTDV